MKFSRTLLCSLLVLSLTAAPTFAHDTDEPIPTSSDTRPVVLHGGGWGHGIGLSQYGSLGRALDGHTYNEILKFYYDNTEIRQISDFEEFNLSSTPETIEVEVAVRDTIAISTPLDELAPGAWELSVEVHGEIIGTSSLPLTTYYDGLRWHAEYTDKTAGITTDLCVDDTRCENTVLEVVHSIGKRAVIEEFEDGPNIASFYGGRYVLQPASVAVDGVSQKDCGNPTEFCVTHSRQQRAKLGNLNVLVGVRERVAISTPLDELGPGEWQLSVEVDDAVIGISTLPLTTYYDGDRWHAEYTDSATQTTTDLCAGDARCANTALQVVQTVGIRTVVEEHEDGPNLGSYASARYLLQPASVELNGSKPDRCGRGVNFCVVVAELDMENYLYGLAEVPPEWPLESMKAQAVAARSYAAATIYNRISASDWIDEPFNLYASTSDQVFAGWYRESGCDYHRWCEAVDQTAGEVLTYEAEVPLEDSDPTEDTELIGQDASENSEPIETKLETRIAQAFYSSSNGGHTVKPSDVWSDGVDLPFLLSKADPYDRAYDPGEQTVRNPRATWTRTYTVAQLNRWLNNYTVGGERPLNLSALQRIEIEQTPPSGRTVFAKVTVTDRDKSITLTRQGELYGYWLLQAIYNGCRSESQCNPPRSSKFTIEWPADVPVDNGEVSEELPIPTPEPTEPETETLVFNFNDITAGDYFFEAASWSLETQITEPARTGYFAPHEEITRAEFVDIIWKFESRTPNPRISSPFEDVPDDATYREAVNNLYPYDIISGTSPTTFSPDLTLTRAQASAILWRYAGRPKPTQPQTFTDVADGTYYADAVTWMLEHRITTGTSETTFAPHDVLTRAEVITVVWRLADLPQAFAPSTRAFLSKNMRTPAIPTDSPV